jgi:flagellar protein FlaJ
MVFLILLLLNFLFLNNNVIWAVSILSLVFPYLFYRSIVVGRRTKLDSLFTNFLLDLGSIMETKISLMQAVSSVSKRDYGALTKYLKKLNTEISWGMPFLDAFIKMGRETKSKLVDKSVSVVVSTFVSGGDLKKIFNAIGHHTREIMKIKDRIRSTTRVTTMTCYMIFFCLLFTVVMIQKTFMPTFADMGVNIEGLSNLIFHMLLIQSMFAGLVTGQMAENNVFTGVKHSAILIAITIVVFTLIL